MDVNVLKNIFITSIANSGAEKLGKGVKYGIATKPRNTMHMKKNIPEISSKNWNKSRRP